METVTETASQNEVPTKEMKDLTWEAEEIGQGGFNDLIKMKKPQKCYLQRQKMSF